MQDARATQVRELQNSAVVRSHREGECVAYYKYMCDR